MRTCVVVLAATVAARITPLCAQELAPRAYLITPRHANVVTLTWSFYNGGLNFNGTVPITGAECPTRRPCEWVHSNEQYLFGPSASPR
jgi:hypothetical protein